jgi:predicted nucleic acid-binding protein
MIDPRSYYLDTNIFIYAIEGNADVAGLLREFFGLFGANRGVAVTSELALAEALVKASDARKNDYLDLMIQSRIFNLEPVTRDILVETAEYRKQAGMSKLPDAIHVVTAIRAGCRTIISADLRLRLPDQQVVLVPTTDNLSQLIRDIS